MSSVAKANAIPRSVGTGCVPQMARASSTPTRRKIAKSISYATKLAHEKLIRLVRDNGQNHPAAALAPGASHRRISAAVAPAASNSARVTRGRTMCGRSCGGSKS
jgi:hypothetical protein